MSHELTRRELLVALGAGALCSVVGGRVPRLMAARAPISRVSPFALSGVMTVALSLVPYSAAYVADAGADAIRHLRAGTTHGALLFLPNITRAFFVLVMSSSAGPGSTVLNVTDGGAIGRSLTPQETSTGTMSRCSRRSSPAR